MKQSRVTIRYAKALLQLSIEQNTLEQSYNDMILLDAVCTESKDLSLLLKSPIVKTDQKLSILKEIFESKLGEVSMAFINIITAKKREGLLALIASSFIALHKEYNKIETATVTTAVPLDEALRTEVINFIKKHGEDNVELTQKVDEKIIGGTIIRMGGKQLDASVLKALSDLRKTFNKNLYIQDF
ncbi:MAG: ATP synthase F1 subunit delta [Flavobacteriales bacterium]|nr:ATP synthase F1 subunit delta [Flavobacteriales bacterium]